MSKDTGKEEGNGSESPETENMEVKDQPQQETAKAKQPKPVTITDIELEQLKNDANEFKHKYLHLLADGENARKRLQKERQEISRYAIESTVIDFLAPLDNMENALKYAQQMSDEVKHWAVGFQMILNQFKEALSNNGITPFSSQGQKFDPHLHEAVEMVESKQLAPGTIIEEHIRGYKMGDRVIRPARVKVAKAPAAPAEENKEKTKEEN